MKPKIITGTQHIDERGVISFVNSFDMSLIKRFYIIEPSSIHHIRAWQGHKVESKWFYCLSGGFEVRVVAVDNWAFPSQDVEDTVFYLSKNKSNVLYIPGGYVNGFRATAENSKLLVFSDKSLADSENDDFRFDKMYWNKW